MSVTVTSEGSTEITVTQAGGTSVVLTSVENVAVSTESKAADLELTEKGLRGEKGDTGNTGAGFTGGSYDAATGKVTFTSDDGLGFSTDDLRSTGSQIDLSTSTSETVVTITPSGGGAATDIASASTSAAGVMTKTLFDKLDGVEAGATANDTDANLKARANHTGTQAASTISDFDTEVSNNSSVAANTLKVTFPGFGTSSSTALRGDTTTISSDQASAITANTSKVSADGSVATHSNVDLTNVAVNDVMKWNGTTFVAAGVDESFAFSWDKVVYDNNTSDVTDNSPTSDTTSTILNGSGNHITSIDVTHTLSNSVESSFVSGSTGSDNLGLQTRDISESTYTGRANLSYSSGSPNASVSVNMAFPTSLTSNSYNRIKTQFKYDGVTYDHQLLYLYKNYMYLGKHTDDTPTNGELQGFQYDEFISNGTSNTTDISAKGVTLNSTSQHIQFWYPNRITTTPTFSVGSSAGALNSETWTAISGTISHTNSAGFTETYRGWKSPNPLDNTGGVNTWYVEVTF